MKTRLRATGAGGSVLMEYVVLCSFVAMALILFWRVEIYDFSSGWQEGTLGLGRSVVEFYQRVLGGIAMPVP